MAYAGIGGLLAFNLNHGLSMNVGWRQTRVIDVEFVGLTQGWAIIVAALITSALAAVTGIGAMRVRRTRWRPLCQPGALDSLFGCILSDRRHRARYRA